MSPLEKKRIAAVKTADAINAIEGAPISSYARSLSASWARGELTGEQMKQALLAYHRRIAEQERQSRKAESGQKQKMFFHGCRLKGIGLGLNLADSVRLECFPPRFL